MAAGVPMAFNGLITIPGRTSGLPRTTGVAIIQAKGRRWVWAPWGDVQWVRNLRAAGRATITLRRRKEEVRATELDASGRVEFFRDILGPVARSMPFGVRFIRIGRRRRSRPSGRGGRRPPGLRAQPAVKGDAVPGRCRVIATVGARHPARRDGRRPRQSGPLGVSA